MAKAKKTVVTLKKLSVDRPTPSSSKDVIPTVTVEGKDIRKYVEAVAKAKEAKEEQDSVKPAVLGIGVPEIMSYNCDNPDSPVSSVRLIDDTAAEVVVSLQNRYSSVSPEAAIAALVEVGVQDVNDYIQEEMAVKFNTAAFHKADGTFNAELFIAVREALAAVAKKFNVSGELIEKDKVVRPNANFHTDRWHDFTAYQNERLHEAMPTVVQVAVR